MHHRPRHSQPVATTAAVTAVAEVTMAVGSVASAGTRWELDSTMVANPRESMAAHVVA